MVSDFVCNQITYLERNLIHLRIFNTGEKIYAMQCIGCHVSILLKLYNMQDLI